jgi:hypothetical protein
MRTFLKSAKSLGHTTSTGRHATLEMAMPIMQFLDWITAVLQKLEPKDILTLALSSVSLVVAGTAFFYTVFSKRRELAISARNDLHDCIIKLPKIKFNAIACAESWELILTKLNMCKDILRLMSSKGFFWHVQYI